MTTKDTLRFVPIIVLTLLVPVGAQQANNEEFAKRQYDSGLSFLQNHRYADAVKDLQGVADSFPESTVADNALLQIAEYQIDIAHNIEATQKAVDRLLKDFANSDSAPLAHVIAGRLALAKGRTQADIDSAMASYERVSRLFPGTEGVAAAGFYAGETLRTVRRVDEALDRYRRVRIEFPRSIWAARAAIGAGYCFVNQGNPQAALQEIQWARQTFPNTPVATDALNLNTIIYRLYVRAPAQPPFTFSGRIIGAAQANYSDVVGLRFEQDGRLLLGHKAGIAVFDEKGAVAATVPAQEPSAFYVDANNRVVVARGSNLIADKGPTQNLFVPDKDGKVRYLEEIPALLLRAQGERLVSDYKDHSVARISSDGKYIGPFAKVAALRMATNSMDEVAMLDKDTKSVFFSDRDSKALGKLANKGTGYEFDEPVDIAFDAFDQLYVLDRGKGTVWVFAPKGNKLITSLSIPEKSPGSFMKANAFSLDRAGRLFIFDERIKRIQVYQ
ncbi:MAG: tetratricopeptide repeat protein [Vicinamibacterales bacterium]